MALYNGDENSGSWYRTAIRPPPAISPPNTPHAGGDHPHWDEKDSCPKEWPIGTIGKEDPLWIRTQKDRIRTIDIEREKHSQEGSTVQNQEMECCMLSHDDTMTEPTTVTTATTTATQTATSLSGGHSLIPIPFPFVDVSAHENESPEGSTVQIMGASLSCMSSQDSTNDPLDLTIHSPNNNDVSFVSFLELISCAHVLNYLGLISQASSVFLQYYIVNFKYKTSYTPFLPLYQ